MSRLKSIIRFRKWELDEKRRILAQLLGERDEIIQTIEAIAFEVSEQAKNSGMEVAAVTLGAYMEGVQIRQTQLAQILVAKEEEVAKHQDIVAEGFRELKTFEIARDRELSRKTEAAAKEEQQAFDELGIQNHAREEAVTDPRYINMRRDS